MIFYLIVLFIFSLEGFGSVPFGGLAKKTINRHFIRGYSTDVGKFLPVIAKVNTAYTLNELMHNKSKVKAHLTDCAAATLIVNGAIECSPYLSEYLAVLPYLSNVLKPVKQLPRAYLRAFKLIEIPKPCFDYDLPAGKVQFGINEVTGVTATKVQVCRAVDCVEEEKETHLMISQLQSLFGCGDGSPNPLTHLSNALFAVSDSVLKADGRAQTFLKIGGYKDTNLLFSPLLDGRMTWKRYCREANLSDLECSNLAYILFSQIKPKTGNRSKKQ